MKIWNYIKQIDNVFSWGFFGFLVGIFGLAFTYYSIFIYKVKPEIKFEILTNTNIIDLKENLSNLEIFYNNKKINKSKQNLRIITIKIVNSGNMDITKNLYEVEEPWGFTIKNANIIEIPKLLDASSQYLKNHIKLNLDTLNKVTISPIIFDQKDFILLKVLAISDSTLEPFLVPTGKISGIGKFEVVDVYQSSKDTSIFDEMLSGGFWIHFLRFWFYFFCLIILSLVIFLPTGIMIVNIQLNKRKKTIEKFKAIAKSKIDDSTYWLLNIYIDQGERKLYQIQKLLLDKGRLLRYLKLYDLKNEEHKNFRDKTDDVLRMGPSERIYIFEETETLANMIRENKLITINNDEIIINEKLSQLLEELIYSLKMK